MTSADTGTSATDVNEPDGVTEMFERRQQRKARRQGRKPRTLPEPRHPKPPAKDGPADDSETGDSREGVVTSADPEPVAAEPEQVAPSETAEPAPQPAAAAGQAELQPAPEPKQAERETAPAPPEPAAGHSVTSQAVSVPPAAAGTAKAASDAALSWAAAARKQALRLDGLATAVRRARAEGVPSLVLSAALADAEYRAGVALPAEVWAATEDGHG